MSEGGDESDPTVLPRQPEVFEAPDRDDQAPSKFSFVETAIEMSEQRVADATQLVEEKLPTLPERDNAIANSARKSLRAQLEDIVKAHEDVKRGFISAIQEVADNEGDRSKCPSAALVFDAYERVQRIHEAMLIAFPAASAPDPAPYVAPAAAPLVIEPPMQASKAIHDDLSQWVKSRRGTNNGDLVIVKATPGVGKTHAMIETAVNEQLAGQAVIMAVRANDDHITGDNPEFLERIVSRNPLGKLALAVIVGRDETNCQNFQAVKAVMEHGYSPGQAVCPRCEYHPDRARTYGFRRCDYYGERMRADISFKNARMGGTHYPMIVTNHASVIAALSSGGGRYGSFWAANLIMFDEDCADAIETEVKITEQQCEFRSALPEHKHANAIAILLSKAIEIGKAERRSTASDDYKKPGTDQSNSNEIHSKLGSEYVGHEFHSVLEHAMLNPRQAMAELTRLLGDVADSQGFYAPAGSLIGVKSVAEINDLNVPPKALATVAEAIHTEMAHTRVLRRIVYEAVLGRPPLGSNIADVMAEVERNTDVEPMSYTCRMQCLPAEAAKGRNPGRKKDEWSFVVRKFSTFTNLTSTIVVGDAYAQKEHYEQLFERPADMIEHLSALHPDTKIIRLRHDGCGITTINKNGISDIWSVVETRMANLLLDDRRVLIYAHGSQQTQVEKYMEAAAERLGLLDWKFEHWWGGRGKDRYNGWGLTICLTDPVLNVSGIKHTVNARAFKASLKAKTDDEKLEHGRRVTIAKGGRAERHIAHRLGSSNARVALEHERVNVSELIQAINRPRPVHNGVNVLVMGASELGVEIAAQTVNITESHDIVGSGTALLIEPARDHEGFPMVHAFVTAAECGNMIRGIINHYGVFSTWFNHALLATPVDAVCPFCGAPSSIGEGKGEFINDLGINAVVNLRTRFLATALIASDPFRPLQQPSCSERHPPCLGTEHASLKGRLPLTVIEQVWSPPVKWQIVLANAPWPLRVAVRALQSDKSLRSMPAPMPPWRRSQAGGRPTLYYDPTLLDGAFTAATAISAYLEIVENQYGPEQGGRLFRPNFNPTMPPPLKAL